MADVSEKALMEKQESITALMKELIGEENADRVLEKVAVIQEEARELEAMAKEFEAQVQSGIKPYKGETEVVLTATQRKKVLDETGVKMESLVLKDEAGTMMQLMPTTDPRIIEYYAIEEAKRRKAADEAMTEARAQLEALFGEIESQASPAMAEMIEQQKNDPAVFGAYFQKK